MSRFYVLTEEGRQQFPRLKDKTFLVRFYALNRDYCQAKVYGRKCWSTWASAFFRPKAVKAQTQGGK